MEEHFFLLSTGIMMVRINHQCKVAILFYMLIVLQEQPEFKQGDHNHEHRHKHPHDHDHDHHRRSRIRKASQIYNGVRTAPGQAKFMAVMVNSQDENHCSAVIITGNMLLTAAHCFDDMSGADVARIRVLPSAFPLQIYRDNILVGHPLIKKIMNFWIHPRYERSLNKRYDIAIMRIGPQPWQLGQEEVDTAMMPINVTNLNWREIKAYGFGREVGEISPAYLNELDFKYRWDQSLAEIVFRFQTSRREPNVIFGVSNYSPHQIDNPSRYSNVGPGDSGGGIFIKGMVKRLDIRTNRTIIKRGLVLAGIVFRGTNYFHAVADLDLPYGVLAINITTMMPWIIDKVRVNFETHPLTPIRPLR